MTIIKNFFFLVGGGSKKKNFFFFGGGGLIRGVIKIVMWGSTLFYKFINMIMTSRHKYGLDLFGCWGLGMDPNPNPIKTQTKFSVMIVD